MNPKFDVLVVGGGVIGLAAALAVAQKGYSVAVLDAGSLDIQTIKTDPRVYAINQASKTLLEELGAWSYLDPKRIAPYQHMHVWDAQNGAAIDFDCRDIAQPFLGHMIEEGILKQAMLKAVTQQQSIRLVSGVQVNDVVCSDEGVVLHTEQKQWHGNFLMVADGARSKTRDLLKVGLTSWPYQQKAVVATVQTDAPHEQTAWQVFHAEGPLAFLPMNNPHNCSIVWSNSQPEAERLMGLSEDDFNQELTTAFANRLGQVRLQGPRVQFPLVMRHVKDYVGARWLLLGDAAHTIHPLAGLGLNMGLADVIAWKKQMQANPNCFLSKKSLGAYQRERKYEVWQIILIMEGLKRMFSTSSKPISLIRGAGLRCSNHLTLLKRFFITHAAG